MDQKKWHNPGQRRLLGLVAFGVGLYWTLQHYQLLVAVFRTLLGLMAPLLLGLAIAFIINVPMRGIERLIFGKRQAQRTPAVGHANKLADDRAGKPAGPAQSSQQPSPSADSGVSGSTVLRRPPRWRPGLGQPIQWLQILRRPTSLLLAILLLTGLVLAVLIIVIPQLVESLTTLTTNLPVYLASIQSWLQAKAAAFPQLAEILSGYEIDWQKLITAGVNYLQTSAGSLFSSTFTFAASVFGGIFTFVLAFIFAIYILLQKEKLADQFQRLFQAYLPAPWPGKITALASLTNDTFTRFLAGQFFEAVILGLLFLTAMLVFGFPYAGLISILIAFTALIPMVGAFIGLIIGMFLILMVDPVQSLWFLIMFLVIQQLENNLIYPRVVGSSIGLPAIWVLAAVTIGGGLFGVAGMLIFIPLCSVLYVLIKQAVNNRLLAKRQAEEPDPAVSD